MVNVLFINWFSFYCSCLQCQRRLFEAELLVTGLSPNVARCVGALRRSVMQKQKEEEEKADRPGKRRTNVRAKDFIVKKQTGSVFIEILSVLCFIEKVHLDDLDVLDTLKMF